MNLHCKKDSTISFLITEVDQLTATPHIYLIGGATNVYQVDVADITYTLLYDPVGLPGSTLTDYVYICEVVVRETGDFQVLVNGIARDIRVHCTETGFYETINQIKDEAVGSWQWDKETGILTLLDEDGNQLTTYTVVDGQTSTSRTRDSALATRDDYATNGASVTLPLTNVENG